MPMTIFETLRRDHDTQRDIIRRLAETSGDSALRRALYSELKRELSAHAAAEERFLYVPMIRHDQSIEKARHSIAEHHEMDDMVDALDALDFASTGWLNQARSLFERIEHHLREEEREVFQIAGKALAEDEKGSLADAYVDEMRRLRQERSAA